MIYYAIAALAIFYFGRSVGKEEERYKFSVYLARKKQTDRKQPPKTLNTPNHAHYETEYHDIHKAAYRCRIFPN